VGWWANLSNRIQFFEEALAHLNIRSVSQLYRLTKKEIVALGGKTLLAQLPTVADIVTALYSSPSALPRSIFGDIDHDVVWVEWKFEELPKATDGETWWTKTPNQLKFLRWIQSYLLDLHSGSTRNSHDVWYSMTRAEFIRLGGSSASRRTKVSLSGT